MHCNYDCFHCTRPDCDRKTIGLARSEYMMRIKGRHQKNASIRRARKAAGMTIAELANRIHRANSTIHHWETGRFRADWNALAQVFPDLSPEPEENEKQ